LPTEESGQLKWHDTPIQSPGNILRFISKKGLDKPFLEVWNVSTIDDIMNINRRSDISHDKIKKSSYVLIETILEIYQMNDIYGVTLHLVMIRLLSNVEDDEGRMIVFQSLKKKRKVMEVSDEEK